MTGAGGGGRALSDQNSPEKNIDAHGFSDDIGSKWVHVFRPSPFNTGEEFFETIH